MELEIEPTIQEIKAGLPVAYVLHRAGVLLDGSGSAVCPFHEDHEPSLDTFAPNRWNCAPCGRGGDVLDLLQAFAPALTFPERMAWAIRLMREMGDWGGDAAQVERQPFDVGAGSALVAEAHRSASWDAIDGICQAKDFPFRGGWLWSEWGVGVSGDRMVIPYWSGDGKLRTYRTRAVDGSDKPRSAPGVSEPTFYGEWRDHGSPLVVICEGESDTWAVDWALKQSDHDVAVLGVPGAGRPPFGLDRLQGRAVVLAFDGDPAGRAATLRWYDALMAGGRSDRVRSLELPDGRDMASYSPEEIRQMVLSEHD